MLRYHRSRYSVDGQARISTWWQLGDRIIRHRVFLP